MLVCGAGASDITPDEADMWLEGVVKRERDVFASSPRGLYRADLSSKSWARLPTPPEMPLGGVFARLPDNSSVIGYVARQANPRIRGSNQFRYGIYLSHDEGQNWRLVAEGLDYGTVLLHPNGKLFAVTNPSASNGPSRVHVSADLGKTWRGIIQSGFGQIDDLFPDPDHRDLICVRGNPWRACVGQAEDENYRWKLFTLQEWYKKHPELYKFFDRTYGTTSRLYTFRASLSNYFGVPFGNLVSLPALDIYPSGERFTFSRGERVVIPVRLEFHENFKGRLAEWKWRNEEADTSPNFSPSTVHLVDYREGTDLWGLRVENPSGERIRRDSPAKELFSESRIRIGANVLRERFRSEREFIKVSLSDGKSYARDLDIGEIFEFSEAGEYRVQLIYDSRWIVNPDRGTEEWGGMFTSPVISVTIK
jgi:hypothetical protein